MATSPNPIQATPAAPQNSPATDSSLSADDSTGEVPVKIHREFSKLQEALVKLADGVGVKRSATISYVDGEPTANHIQAVGKALAQTGGLTNNLVMSAHHSSGRGWGTGDGATVGYPADKLRQTIIPKGDANAKASITAAKSFVNAIASLTGDTAEIKTAKAQLTLVGVQDGGEMTAQDFLVALQQIIHQPLQALARAHSGVKDGRHAPQL